MVAALAYPLGLIGAFAINAVLVQQMVIQLTGVEIAWQIYLIISVVIVGGISYFGVDLSAMVVLTIVIIEVSVIALLIVAILVQDGLSAFPIEALSFDSLTFGSAAVAFIFAMLCFQGYEAGAMYSAEAKNPRKTVPRALYVALILIVATLALSSWVLTGVTGVTEVQSQVTGAEGGPGNFVFTVVREYLGTTGMVIFSLGTLLSIFAIEIAITNFMSRYLNKLASEDLLPAPLAQRNAFNAPGAAIIALMVSALVVNLGAGIVGLDPLTQVSSVAIGVGALCATIFMASASASVVLFFQRLPKQERHWWKTVTAPVIATVLLVGALIIQLNGFPVITGSDEAWTAVLPWFVLLVGVGGVGFGFWLKKYRPRTYKDPAAGDSAEEAAALREKRLAETAVDRQARRAGRAPRY